MQGSAEGELCNWAVHGLTTCRPEDAFPAHGLLSPTKIVSAAAERVRCSLAAGMRRLMGRVQPQE